MLTLCKSAHKVEINFNDVNKSPALSFLSIKILDIKILSPVIFDLIQMTYQ